MPSPNFGARLPVPCTRLSLTTLSEDLARRWIASSPVVCTSRASTRLWLDRSRTTPLSARVTVKPDTVQWLAPSRCSP